MAVPKKKVARSMTKRRHTVYANRTQKKLENRVSLSTCSNCGEKHLSHNVCTSCGFYRGKEIITKKKVEVTKISA
jgi:large subunit ribosomal protein L32